mgnify:FL=1
MGISRENRARQFLPFDALKGLQEALREKEIELDERKELSEESIEELSNNLQLIERGDNVRLTYYHQKKYITIEGKVIDIKVIQKKLILEGELRINFADIIYVEII